MTSGPHVIVHTDGACSGNPGPGGWGAILSYGEHEKEMSGGEAHTTNNRMELMAAIAALEALKRPSTVELHTDSEYVRQGITQWIFGWRRKGWSRTGRSRLSRRRRGARALPSRVPCHPERSEGSW